MESVTKIIHIYRKHGGLFAAVNKAVLQEGNQHIGASINGKIAIMLKDEELKSYMPRELGTQPNNPEFTSKLSDYFDNMSIYVPEQGLPLEVGFIYDLTAVNKTKAIDELSKLHKKEFKSDADLARFVELNVKVDDKWKYGTPISVRDYSIWRYIENYRDVANSNSDINKSKHIRFYIHDDTIARQEKEVLFKLRNKATKVYIDIITKPEEVETILFALGLGDTVANKTSSEHAQTLETYKNSNPNEFIKIAQDKNLQGIAYIEKLIAYQILVRDAESSLISNPVDGEVLGKNAKEALAFLNDAKNAKLANEVKGRLDNTK